MKITLLNSDVVICFTLQTTLWLGLWLAADSVEYCLLFATWTVSWTLVSHRCSFVAQWSLLF